LASKVGISRALKTLSSRVLTRLRAPELGDLGRRGEALAARELERRGYRILERRWRCRLGELDLVAWDGGMLVVVEVKARSRLDFGRPVDAVDFEKRRRLRRLALAYLKARKLVGVTVRFDVVGVTALPGQKPRIEVLPDAFPF
jgi:putative endonuclease